MKITKKDKIILNDQNKYNTNSTKMLNSMSESVNYKSKKLSNGNNEYISENKSKELLNILKSKQNTIKLSKKGESNVLNRSNYNSELSNFEKNNKRLNVNEKRISNYEINNIFKKELNEKSIRETIKSRLSKNKHTLSSSLNSSVNESFNKSPLKYSINGLQDNFNKRKLYKVPFDNKSTKNPDDNNLYLKKLTPKPLNNTNKPLIKQTIISNNNVYIKKNNLHFKKNVFIKNDYNTDLQTSMDGMKINGYNGNGMLPLVHINSKEKKERSNSFILYKSNHSHSKSSKPDTPSFEKDFSLDKSFSSNRQKEFDVNYNVKNVSTQRKFTHRNREEIFSFGYSLK
jgi:hypothetical protein